MLGTFQKKLPKSVLTAALAPQPVIPSALGPLAHPSSSAWALSPSQFQRLGPQPILVLALGPQCILRRLSRPSLIFGNLLLEKLYILEVATWEIVIWEVAYGNIMGKHHFKIRIQSDEIYLLDSVVMGNNLVRLKKRIFKGFCSFYKAAKNLSKLYFRKSCFKTVLNFYPQR